MDAEIDDAIKYFNEKYKPAHLGYRGISLGPADDHNRTGFDIFAVDSNGNETSLSSSNLTNLAHILAGYGRITSGASKYMRDVADGAIEAKVDPASTPSPAAAAAAPSTQIQVPVAAPVVTQSLGTQLALASPYLSCIPVVGNNTLVLTYFLNGTVNLPTTNQSYNALKLAIENTVQSITHSSRGVTLKAHVQPLSHQNGSSFSQFEVRFSRMLVSTPERLQNKDMQDIAKALETAGCLTSKDRQTVDMQVARAVRNSGWSHRP